MRKATMDNTQVLSPNGPLCVTMNGGTSKKSVFGQHSHAKQYTGGPIMTVCSHSGKPSLLTSVNADFYQFQIRNASTFNMRSHLQESGKFPMEKLLSSIIPATDAVKATANADATHEDTTNQINSICDRVNGESDGNPFVNIMKNFLGYLIKPIIETKTRIIGNDKSKADFEPQTLTAKLAANSYDYRRNQFGSMPDMFFDCDDFVEGSEDTVDFVADSTKILWNSMSSSDSIYYECNTFLMVDESADSRKAAPPASPRAAMCADKIAALRCALCPAAVPTLPLDKQHNSTVDRPKAEAIQCQSVQYTEDKPASLIGTMDPVCMSRNNVKRKRRRDHLAKSGGKRSELSHKTLAATKNHHEKNRHNVQMNILDDFSMYSMSEAEDDGDSDGTVGDSDGDVVVADDLIALKPTKPFEDVVPEVIPSGCMFTYFYRLASPLKGLSSIPAHLLARLMATPAKATQHEQSCSMAHLTETESDDSFITFDDSCDDDDILKSVPPNAQRRRQSSECSDDFIVFCSDSNDGNGSYNESFDDDYTDSSDDSDNEDEQDDVELDTDEESDFDCGDDDLSVASVCGKHTANSVLNSKKVRFNLCPEVHLMRTWKYAYSQARKSQFLHYQLDKERFEKRIKETGQILLPILACDHRRKVFSERFQE